jgi:hypothetical protein
MPIGVTGRQIATGYAMIAAGCQDRDREPAAAGTTTGPGGAPGHCRTRHRGTYRGQSPFSRTVRAGNAAKSFRAVPGQTTFSPFRGAKRAQPVTTCRERPILHPGPPPILACYLTTPTRFEPG